MKVEVASDKKHVWLMQPEAQTTTRSSLAVSAVALEIANVIQGALYLIYLFLPFNIHEQFID